MEPMTLAELLRLTSVAERRNPSWRRGQAAFNTVAVNCPEIGARISGGPKDPFYNDANLPDFWMAVGEAL